MDKVTLDESIPLDSFVGEGPAIQVVWLDPQQELVPADAAREPHRHDYHELFLVRSGTVQHRIDDVERHQGAGTALVVGRGQVHVLERTAQADGVVVRFQDALLTSAAHQASPGWLLVNLRSCLVAPTERELDDLLELVRLLDTELLRPRDAFSSQLLTYLLSSAVVNVRRWQQAAAPVEEGAPTSELTLFHAFSQLLEGEYTRQHAASWYAGELAVSPGHLSAVLADLTGRSTKRLIGDRLMTEARRLLRHTNLGVQQVAHQLGYDDPLYFSRVFRQHVGQAPSVYRAS